MSNIRHGFHALTSEQQAEYIKLEQTGLSHDEIKERLNAQGATSPRDLPSDPNAYTAPQSHDLFSIVGVTQDAAKPDAPLSDVDKFWILYEILQSGGTSSYLWCCSEERKKDKSGDKFTKPKTKRTIWHPTGVRPSIPQPIDRQGNHINVYFGIYPTDKSGAPYQRSSKNPSDKRPYVQSANCFYAEFDAKDFDPELMAASVAYKAYLKTGASPTSFEGKVSPDKGLTAVFAHVASLPIPPSFTIISGGGIHGYWLTDQTIMLDDFGRQKFTQMLESFVGAVGGDDSAKDIARVLRVPGTLNHKGYYEGSPLRVKFDTFNPELVYSIEQVEQFIKSRKPSLLNQPNPKHKAAKAKPKPAKVKVKTEATEEQPEPKYPRCPDHVEVDTYKKVINNIRRLSFERCDNHAPWVKVGMALYNEFDGADWAFTIFDEWSKQSSKYDQASSLSLWESLANNQGEQKIKLGSLINWANKDDYRADKVSEESKEKQSSTLFDHFSAIVDDHVSECEQDKRDFKAAKENRKEAKKVSQELGKKATKAEKKAEKEKEKAQKSESEEDKKAADEAKKAADEARRKADDAEKRLDEAEATLDEIKEKVKGPSKLNLEIDRWIEDASGMTYGHIESLAKVLAHNGVPKRDANAWQKLVHTAKGKRQRQALEKKKAEVVKAKIDYHEPLLDDELHDAGHASSFLKFYGDKYLFVHEWGTMFWTGTHWSGQGGDKQLFADIRDHLAARWQAAIRASDLGLIEDSALKYWQSQCKPSTARINAIKSQILNEPKLDRTPDHFDNSPNLLSVANGVIDFQDDTFWQTGIPRPHCPSDMITHCLPTNYNPDANDALIDDFLISVEQNDEDRSYLKRTVGYYITGWTNEEILTYVSGPTRSGKGTFMTLIKGLMTKQLSAEINTNVLMSGRNNSDSQNFALAPLSGHRVVVAQETDKKKKLSTNLIKNLTGNDDIFCAFKGKTHFSYTPIFKIFMTSNNPPMPDDVYDQAFWDSRLRWIRFPKSFLGKEDKNLKHKFASKESLEAFLKWAVDGTYDWLNDGLNAPFTMTELIEREKASQDHVKQWLEESAITPNGDERITSKELYSRYKDWAIENGTDNHHQHKAFVVIMKSKGFTYKAYKDRVTKKARRGFVGISIG